MCKIRAVLVGTLYLLSSCASIGVLRQPPPPPKPSFLIRSHDGVQKCLDYGTPPALPGNSASPVSNTGKRTFAPSAGASATTGSTAQTPPSVFLNDCDRAHPIWVEELNSGKHEVILHAGSNQIIGIQRPSVNTLGGSPGTTQGCGYDPNTCFPPPPVTATAPLQLIHQSLIATFASVDKVFALDGDSIILESSRPCTSTDTALCPAPPAQLVAQVQNAAGINGTPIIVGPRQLADAEFWDFQATDNSATDPTTGFVHVSTAEELWNAYCAAPTASNAKSSPQNGNQPLGCNTLRAGWGTVLVISNSVQCNNVSGDEPDIGPCIDLSGFAALVLPAGVTVRGDRRSTNLGPQLYAAYFSPRGGSTAAAGSSCDWCMFQVHGDYVRLTGLRMRGQSRRTDQYDNQMTAIYVDFPTASSCADVTLPCYWSSTEYIVAVDHNDISDWEGGAVIVDGGHEVEPYPFPQTVETLNEVCGRILNDPGTQANVSIERNFLHHNMRWGDGYGSVMTDGGRAFIEGNTFLMNRHSIASSGEAHSEYRAWYNLILENVPVYSVSNGGAQQDFDMHGTGKVSVFLGFGDSTGYDGLGGSRVDIAGNTFLSGLDGALSRFNFELRGHPCYVNYFRNNVTERSASDHAINLHHINAPTVEVVNQGPNVPRTPVEVPLYERQPVPVASGSNPVYLVLETNNQYPDSSPAFVDPTAQIKVGDFDGDGGQDLFLATGTAWYFSPGGTAEWRLLSAKTERVDALLFGDFDGDGRTDVVTIKGGYVMVSWGGISDWELLNPYPLSASVSDLAVGNFVDDYPGDRRDDLFWADGASWRVSSGGSGSFNFAQTSSFRVKDLRFGDFEGQGHTDVFGVGNGGWQISQSVGTLPLGSWTALPVSLTNKIDGLVVANFNNDGFSGAYIALPGQPEYDDNNDITGWTWKFWHPGLQTWKTHVIAGTDPCKLWGINELAMAQAAPIGHFDTSRSSGADILVFNGNSNSTDPTELCIAAAGTGDLRQWSRQDMR
jgi:hypothetical protein